MDVYIFKLRIYANYAFTEIRNYANTHLRNYALSKYTITQITHLRKYAIRHLRNYALRKYAITQLRITQIRNYAQPQLLLTLPIEHDSKTAGYWSLPKTS